mgnify:CR=1 FL=1
MADPQDTPTRLPGFIRRLDVLLKWIALVCGGLTLVFMTGFSAWNVLIMRKVFNAPILGAEDLMVLALVTVVALSIPYGARTGAHIEIELLEARMSAGFGRWSMIVVKAIGTLLLFIMARQLWHAGQSAVRFGETTQQLLISYEPFYYMLATSALLFGIVLITDIWQLLRLGTVLPLHAGDKNS